MGGNPRENVKGKGFWDGGTPSQGENGQSAGRTSGFPGSRGVPKHAGLRTDIEFPEQQSDGDESDPNGNA